MIQLSKQFKKYKNMISVLCLVLVISLTSCFFIQKEAPKQEVQNNLEHLQNLQANDILQIEWISYKKTSNAPYHLLSQEEISAVISSLHEIKGDFKGSKETSDGDGNNHLYITTKNHENYHLSFLPEKLLVFNEEIYTSDETWLTTFPKIQGDSYPPVYFYLGRQEEPLKGLELFVWKNSQNEMEYNLFPASKEIKLEEQIYNKHTSTSDLNAVQTVLARQKEGLTLSVSRIVKHM